STTAYLYGTDNNPDYLNFYLNGGYIGTNYSTSGTRSIAYNLGPFYDEGVSYYTGQVQDSAGNWSNAATQAVTVLNVAPTINQITPNLTINEGDWFDFLVNATDPGIYDVLTYDWDIDGDGLYDDYRGQTGRYSYADEGSYRWGVQVNDGDGGFDWGSFNIDVLNVAPTITQLTENLLVKRNEFFDFFGVATDPGLQDLLTFDWDFNGDGIFDDFTGTSGQWSFADPGMFDVALRVSDGDGGFAYRSFTVEAVPEPSSLLGFVTLGLLGASVLRKSKSQEKS
ncbi:MAG: PKD domain-containing protein, partial [Jaaginema sp. PMC 1079.18]|nr:PKD domain-containing protein [Jaaginema sp. PMC 1079.18]